jgi:hypothetical protein
MVCLVVAVAMVPLALSGQAHAANWQLRFDISVPYPLGEGGKATQVVAAGVRLTALDGFDNTWDTVVTSSSVLSAYVYHPTFAPEYQFLSRDYRFDSYPKQWDFYVMSDQDVQPITLQWTVPQAAAGSCLGTSWTLTDVTASTDVDLMQSTYQYVNTGGVPRQFQLVASQVVESPPQQPVNLFSPRVGTSSVLMAWTGTAGISGYHIYRKDPGSIEYRRRTVAPAPTAKYVDSDVNPGSYAYLVMAVTSTGCESGPSNELTVQVGQ